MSDRLRALSEDEWKRVIELSSACARYQASPTGTEESDLLRMQRRAAWMTAAGHSLLGTSTAREVCFSWSETADRLLSRAYQQCFDGSQTALFALGKLGSKELNLSSDVDILLVSQSEDPAHLPALRRFQKLLAEASPTGFVFRVDFDLRPGGRNGPLIPTLDQFIDYYGNYGETWERLAFVRLRPICGSAEISRAALEFAGRFSFRRHLDYTLLEDLKNLRSKIHAEHWKRGADGRVDLKLGIGGIRDVELFFHALQVIHGGKDPGLRTGETTEAARRLAAKKILTDADAEFLVQHYWNLRSLENYVQALGDAQTHLLTPDIDLPAWLKTLADELGPTMARCSRIVATLIGDPPAPPAREELSAQLTEKEVLEPFLAEILEVPLLTRNKERDEQARLSFLNRFLEVLREQGGQPTLALTQLKEFLKATRAKTTFFTLLLREEKLLRELAWLFGHSPYLGRLLCYRPELLDAFVFRTQELRQDDLGALLEDLAEKKLLTEVIEGSRFLRSLDLQPTTEALTTTADDICLALEKALKQELTSEAHLLALGKWGARETGFRSDLDFVFVAPQDAGEADIKYARRFISRLTEPHRGGSIYSIDLRLRPSGKAGPIVIRAEELQKYLQETAAPWERQAYLRARWIGTPAFGVQEACVRRPLTATDWQELDRIREGLIKQKEGFDLKYREGGLVDLELFAQSLVLQNQQIIPLGHTPTLLSQGISPSLARNYISLRQIEQSLQLISAESVSEVLPNHESIPALAALFKMSENGFLEYVSSLFLQNIQELKRLDPRRLSR